MKTLKRAIAVLLTLVLLSGSIVCFAAESDKQYYDYDKILLLGDSEASGFRDYVNVLSEFTYVEDSFAAYVAKEFDAELIPMACPGFRTVELRYMLDDNYRPDDMHLFRQVPYTPKDEIIAKIPQMRQAIAESDLILIGIGGNDRGSYLGWVIAQVQFEYGLSEEYKAALADYLRQASFDDNVITDLVDLADYLNSTDELIATLPVAIEYAFSSLWSNWEYIMDYIYANNPDVTVAAIGMFPTYLKTEEGAPDVVIQPDPISSAIEDMIIELGNKHIIDNQDKYGYVFVDTHGTTVERTHPTLAGQRFIADRILEALPDARCSFTDITFRSSSYKAVEYMYLNGYMNSVDETTFGANVKITESELSEVLNKVTGKYSVTDSKDEVSNLDLSKAMFKATGKISFMDMFKFFVSAVKLVLSGNAFKTVTRAEAAVAIYNVIK